VDDELSNICKIKGYIKPEMYDISNKASKAGLCKIEITKPGYLKRVFEVTANKDILISTMVN